MSADTNHPQRPKEEDAPREPTGEVDMALRAARYWITANRPYYARALFACRMLITTSVDTMTIDRQWRIYANPEYVLSIDVGRLAGLMIHNLNHGIREHAKRGEVLSFEARLGNVWTVSCDCEIDDDLAEDGLTLPDDLPFPYMWTMSNGKTAERYYRELHEGGHVEQIVLAAEANQMPHGSCGSAASGIAEKYEAKSGMFEGTSELERALLRRSTAEAVQDYAKNKGIGTVPQGLLRWAQEHLQPKVDWRKALSSALRRALHQNAGTADYSWRRPPRRQQPGSPLQFPGMVQPVPSITVVMDTSMSMGSAELAQGNAEIMSILTRVVPGYAVRVLSVDAHVAADVSVAGKRLIEFVGGGGTDMRVGIAEAAKTRPAAIVVITDGYTPWPDQRPRGATAVIAAIMAEPTNRGRHLPQVPSWIKRVEVPIAV